MGSTTAGGIPYPVSTDTPDVPRDVKALADWLQANTPRIVATYAALPAANSLPAGTVVYVTADARSYMTTGTVWTRPAASVVAVAASAAVSAETVIQSVAFTADGVTPALVAWSVYNLVATVLTDTHFAAIWDGPTAGAGTMLARQLLVPNGNANIGGVTVLTVVTLSAGAHTLTARLSRNAGTGTIATAASAGSPTTLLAHNLL